LERLHGNLLMILIGPTARTVVLKGNPVARERQLGDAVGKLTRGIGQAKIKYVIQEGASTETKRASLRVIDAPTIRTNSLHGTRIVEKARQKVDKKEERILNRTDGLLDPKLRDEDIGMLLKGRRRQIDKFVRDFETSLLEHQSCLEAALPLDLLSDSTRKAFSELAEDIIGVERVKGINNKLADIT
ncbi:hypothetical protein FOL47_003693, partial [Perkinsus chesapeaki]